MINAFRTAFPELDCRGNRAVALPLDQPLPTESLLPCLQAALLYHRIKDEPNLIDAVEAFRS